MKSIKAMKIDSKTVRSALICVVTLLTVYLTEYLSGSNVSPEVYGLAPVLVDIARRRLRSFVADDDTDTGVQRRRDEAENTKNVLG